MPFFATVEEETAEKQSELSLLTDEVERASSRLASLEREKVSIGTTQSLDEMLCFKLLFSHCRKLSRHSSTMFKLETNLKATPRQ